MSVLDSHGRTLTSAERQQQELLRPALQAWTAYLTATETAPTGRFEDAERRRSAVILRHVPALDKLRPPVAVCPAWAHEWAMRNGHRGNPGSGSPVTYGLMVDALDFMRAQPAVTFRPQHDSHDRRRRDGFFHLTAEMHARLWSGRYVPVLTPRVGRPRTHMDRKPAPRSGRLRRATADPTIDIVRDWVRTSDPTALYTTATRERRPLTVRPAGRPSTTARRGAPITRTHVLGTVDMLIAHAVEHSGRTDWRVPSARDFAISLATHAAATPELVSQVTRFSTPDAPRQRHVRGWWRFSLAALGRPLLDPAELLAEVTYWQDTQDRPIEPAPVVATGFVLPPGTDPAWLEDPEYRDALGMTDDDYARWKAGE